MKQADADAWEASIQQSADSTALIENYRAFDTYKKELAESTKMVNKLMKLLENALADRLLIDGHQSVTTPNGVVEYSHRNVATVSDWEAFYAWIAEDPLNRMQGFLHKRAGSTEIGKYASDNEGAYPPGCEETIITDIKVKPTPLAEG